MATDLSNTQAFPKLARAARVANIGPVERRRRLLMGLAMLCTGLGLALLLIGMRAGAYWRLGLFIPLWLAALMLLQARARTCVALAEKGQRDLGAGPEPIEDAVELALVRRQANIVTRTALVAAGLGTFVVLFLSPR
ncbi:MAG TPA: hypothetical protein VGQ83_17655 [Polyangia bacterium]|jgi:hypothetical protein